MPDVPEPDTERDAVLRAAVDDFAATASVPDGSSDDFAPALDEVDQIPINSERTQDAVHVPGDAGEYEDALPSLLLRIPPGSGRSIGCSRGWDPILARLDEQLRALDPDYVVFQIKEKFGTLRFYCSGKWADKGRVAIDQATIESARTCESCGQPGRLRSRRGWYRTLCGPCADMQGYEDLAE